VLGELPLSAAKSVAPLPVANRLLNLLPAGDRRAIRDLCDPVQLDLGRVLAEPGAAIRYVYLPQTAFISVVAPGGAGAALHVALVGNEGLLGAWIALGVNDAPLHALVRGAGSALRMPAARFRSELIARPALRELLLCYCYVLHRQVAQTAACTHNHPVEARLARWLLMTQDRACGAALQLTQQYLSGMLGVRREGVTQAAGALRARRLIGYRRGQILVLSRRGLEAAACRCYAGDKRLYEWTPA
jgi:CRP-like cAMP-binding protein